MRFYEWKSRDNEWRWPIIMLSYEIQMELYGMRGNVWRNEIKWCNGYKYYDDECIGCNGMHYDIY